MIAKLLILFALVSCSGCTKAEMSDARLNHLMAGDHGWIDLTIKSVPLSGKLDSKDCFVSLSVNGENILRESANFTTATLKGSPIGYRFPVPSGQLDIDLTFSACVKEPYVVKLPLSILKDQLANITFEDNKLNVDAKVEYKPASLDLVRSQLGDMRNHAANNERQISNTNTLLLLCLGLNLFVVVFLVLRRRNV